MSWLVRRYVAGHTDITLKSREQYEWAIPHIENGLGAIQLSLLDRDDVATWISNLAEGGKLSQRVVQPRSTIFSSPLRAIAGLSRSGSACCTGCVERSRRTIPLERIVAEAELLRLASHGLRHTAATHMCRERHTSASCVPIRFCSDTALRC